LLDGIGGARIQKEGWHIWGAHRPCASSPQIACRALRCPPPKLTCGTSFAISLGGSVHFTTSPLPWLAWRALGCPPRLLQTAEAGVVWARPQTGKAPLTALRPCRPRKTPARGSQTGSRRSVQAGARIGRRQRFHAVLAECLPARETQDTLSYTLVPTSTLIPSTLCMYTLWEGSSSLSISVKVTTPHHYHTHVFVCAESGSLSQALE